MDDPESAVLEFVPPLATGNVPVTPVVNGNPVKFVATPDAGVPSAGVTSVGEVASTTFPLPVVAVTASAPVPPEVVTTPFVVRLLNVAMFCDVFTVIVLVLLVKPVENVSGTSNTPVGDELVQVVPFEVSRFPEAPGATNVGLLAPLPRMTLLAVNVVSPVPPLPTGKAPVTFAVRSMAPFVISPFTIAPHDGFPAALPCNTFVVVPWFANKADARVGVK
jgi:hypothetical protein